MALTVDDLDVYAMLRGLVTLDIITGGMLINVV